MFVYILFFLHIQLFSHFATNVLNKFCVLYIVDGVANRVHGIDVGLLGVIIAIAFIVRDVT